MSPLRESARMARSTLHRLFDVSLYIKGVDGLLELVGGLLFLVLPPQAIGASVRLLTAHELSEDPSDRFATVLRHVTSTWLEHPGHFASIYLIAHGIIKLFLVINVLRERRWAFVPALAFLAAFVVYQVYRFTLTHSPALIAFAGVDVVVIALVWLEYRTLSASFPTENGRK